MKTAYKIGLFLVALTLVGFAAQGVADVFFSGDQEEKLAAARERAKHFELAYNKVTRSFEERALQPETDEGVMRELRERNERLAERLEETEAHARTLSHQVTALEDSLEGQATAERVDNHIEVALDQSTDWPKSTLRVFGPVKVWPDDLERTTADLKVEGELHTNLSLSRLESGGLRADVWFDTDALEAKSVRVVSTPEDPFCQSTPSSFLDITPEVDLGTGFIVISTAAITKLLGG